MKRFTLQDRIGDIGAINQDALNIFLKYDIDFCCGGNRSLEEAIKGTGIDGDKLLDEINSSYEKMLNQNKGNEFLTMAPEKLIAHINRVHHDYLKENLPLIAKLTNKIEAVHGSNHSELSEVNKLFNALKEELEKHLKKEEEVLFPLIEALSGMEESKQKEELKKVVTELEDEHENAGQILKTLRKITNHYKVPDDGCQTYALTYDKLKELENDLYHHIHLENNILFKNL